MRIECCHNCTTETGRHPGCHATCRRYKIERSKLDKEKADKRKEFEVRDYIFDAEMRRRDQSAKKRKSITWHYDK